MSQQTQFALINDLAHKAQGSDPEALRRVVGQMVSVVGAKGPLRDLAEERALLAELKYRTGQHETISEKRIFLAFNHIVDHLSLPSYVRTSANQVRAVRMAMLVCVPSVGAESFKMKAGVIDDQMSPMEATLVLSVLVSQKLNNPDFQMEPEEWDRKQSLNAEPTTDGSTQHVLVARVSSRRQEVLKSISASTSTFSATALAALVNTAMDEAGF
ncbi:MAG: hypothetical protein WAM71_05025 [Candidatus Korobacteraceae bacterium]